AKLQDQKITQPHSLDGSIATIDDTYAQVQGKRVKLLDLRGEEVASGILMSEDKEKVVMGK
ncbi:hypothetical protein Taro_033571, partial [Colocasia esculenta]|nr:hypothetical protein [Colocasia esculenta]